MANVEQVLDRLDKVRKGAKGWTARCPAHDDKGPSLWVNEGHDGKVILHCYAGCYFSEIVSALGFQEREMFPDDGRFEPIAEGKQPAFFSQKECDELEHQAHFCAVFISDVMAKREPKKSDLITLNQCYDSLKSNWKKLIEARKYGTALLAFNACEIVENFKKEVVH